MKRIILLIKKDNLNILFKRINENKIAHFRIYSIEYIDFAHTILNRLSIHR